MHRGVRVQFRGRAQAGQQAPVLGHVVRDDAEVLGGLHQGLPRHRIEDHRAVARGPRVAPRPAVGLDDELPRGAGRLVSHRTAAYSPESAVRTRMRRQFSQRTTVSGAAERISLSSVMASSWRHPWQLRWYSLAAPTPPCCSRSLP
ncbi:hypothetical protein B0E38_03145 [Streptomyces sp. 111WW2]|nr:hypothetical protein B0E38_03145 [Streptomyces sp. 111WW2]